MSAVPQKKICWNCEGNVDRNMDNCSYCGVYLHAPEEELSGGYWNPSYRAPFNSEIEEDEPSSDEEIIGPVSDRRSSSEKEVFSLGGWAALSQSLKRDLFPVLFLMLGSVFFLFGIVLLLFSQNGVLTLQWKESDGFYFFLFSFPLVVLGWVFLQRLDLEK